MDDMTPDFEKSLMDQLPTAADIIAFLKEGRGRVKRGALAKHFKLKGAQRRALRHLLRAMAEKGQIVLGAGNYVALPKPLPNRLTLEVKSVDPEDGALMAIPVERPFQEAPSLIYVESMFDLAIGDHVEARLTHLEGQTYVAHPIRKLEKRAQTNVLGSFMGLGKGLPGQITPLDSSHFPRRYLVQVKEASTIPDGAIVLAKPLERTHDAPPVAEIVEVLGESIQGLESMIAIHNFGIPYEFPEEAIEEAKALPEGLKNAEIAEREDLRAFPFVTIDGVDAKDFDDAIFVEKNDDGTFSATVAIADVAHYIREGGALDAEAFKRGNSTYFPDRVVPMLPEQISNNLCSLRPHEDRPVVAVRMTIDQAGHLKKFKFVRAVIHSHARLTYDQVMDAIQGQFDDVTKNLWSQNLEAAYGCYKVLLKAREARYALDLDMPETSIIIGPGGEVMKAEKRLRHDAHRLIEELMIAANVAAAKVLEGKKAPCLYRVHLPPTPEKLELLKAILQQHKIDFKKSVNVQPEHVCDLIDKVQHLPEGPLLMQSILRTQQQAVYTPENKGHFGLALTHYAHFTSPIRRYSDLIVHRSLIQALALPGKGALKVAQKGLYDVAEHISITERRSQRAEWEAKDRIIARYYQNKIGDVYEGMVVSVQKFGVFVMIEEGVAEGLVPMRLMGEEYFRFEEKRHILIGERSGAIFKVGTKAPVTLIGADPTTGQLTFALGEVDPQNLPTREGRPQNRGRRNKEGYKKPKKSDRKGNSKGGKASHKKRKPERKVRK